MKLYATHDAQMHAFCAELCGQCGAQRYDHEQDADDDGRAFFGRCALTNCSRFEDVDLFDGDFDMRDELLPSRA